MSGRLVKDFNTGVVFTLDVPDDWIFIDQSFDKVTIEHKASGSRCKLQLGDALLAGIFVPGISEQIEK